ncbi:RTA1 like protein-domain-containing protein [Cadophora sp. MPI-SDFR-AT-0126]|nr:RTA1 like protein-domain-containing protein [Leotiomycetes sp. MPI-SDFR-AT-0126]
MGEFSKYWEYEPSLAAAVIFSLTFAILSIYHTSRLFKTRTWFCIPLVIGGFFEVIGFGARAVGNKKPDILLPYLFQSLLILLAPIFFAASVYMILSRLIRAVGAESHSVVRVTWVTKVFVGGDILCFLIQAGGGAILSGADTMSSRKLGQNLILSGLLIQIVVFAFFLVVAVVFHKRIRARPTGQSLGTDMSLDQFMLMLYRVSILITLRNLFRVIEYAMGKDSYLLQHEWPIYAFDGLPMIIVLVICSKWYIGDMKSSSVYIDLEGINPSGPTQHGFK